MIAVDLYRQLFEQMPCYVTAQDRDLRIVAANALFRRDFDANGSHCYEVYKHRTDKCPDCPVERTFSDGKIHTSEEVVRRNDGCEVAVIVYTSPVFDNDGKVVAVVEASTDITDVKTLQKKFHTLFDEAPCYISVQDRDLRILDANRRFTDDFGDAVGESCYAIYKHRTEPCIVCPVAETFQDGHIHQSEEVVTSRNGRQVNVLCHTAPLRNVAGEIEAVMEMSTNITEIRTLEDQLTSLGLIVSSVSHGIKGLLGGLDGGIYLMETGFAKDDSERTKKGWEMVRRNVDAIRSMVMNILHYTKEREVFWEPIEIEEIMGQVVDNMNRRAEMLGVELKMTVRAGSFEGDRHAIHSMLTNLLENSIDACRHDKQKRDHAVTLTASPTPDGVLFEIADNGIGMDRETREKAFSLFFSSKGTEGTGLGLFVAHKIVKSHGGTIAIDSTPNVGTKFSVRLPQRRPDDNGGSDEGSDH